MKSPRKVIVWITLLPILVILLGGLIHLRPRRTLVLWSCGGNYELLKDYAVRFEAKEGVRVRYTAAPVAFLLARALDCANPPDVMVGRGGPGWDALVDVGRALGPPTVFAADPLVLAVPPGNPARIESVEDLGRPDVRVALSPGAMRPKSRVPAMFLSEVSDSLYPGLVERWENQAVSRDTCGRRLLDPLLTGAADVAVAPLSLLTYPAYRGRIEEVPIPAAVLRTMAQAPAIPQCALTLAGPDSRQVELAQRFVQGLVEERELLVRHGYVPIGDPRSQEFGHLLTVLSPKDMPAWQTFFAEALDKAGLAVEARRRYLNVLYTFAPNRHLERALCRTADYSLALGQVASARLDWQRVLNDFPPGEPVEYDLPTSPRKAALLPIREEPHEVWREEARARLRDLPPDADGTNRMLDDPIVRELFPVRITQGDPPKNSTRSLGLGLHLLVAGDYGSATRDLLKVPTLHYPSRHMAVAEYLLGLCAEARGLPEVARAQWERTRRDFPGTPAAEAAEQALARLHPAAGTAAPSGMPPWTEAFATHPERGMTYGMRLHAHRLPLYTVKEMLKLQSGIYGQHPFAGEARFRAGVACQEMSREDAAVRQWRAGLREAADSPWSEKSRAALLACGKEPVPLPGPTPPIPKGGPGQRFRLAEELFQAGLHDDGQAALEYFKVLTVARPPDRNLTPESRAMLGRAAEHLAVSLRACGRSEAEIEATFGFLPQLPPPGEMP